MLDPKRAAELIRKHFAQLTTEQFLVNLKQACPEILEDNEESEAAVKSSVVEKASTTK